MHVASIITDHGISLFINNKSYAINRDHPSYAKIVEKLKAKDHDGIEGLLDYNVGIKTWLTADLPDEDFTVANGLVSYKGRAFSAAVSDKVLRMIDAGAEAQPLLNFLRKLRKNPSSIAQQELLLFCVANQFLIHEDGDIIAYKSVRDDYLDIHSGTVLYKLAEDMTDEERERLPHTNDRGVSVAIENGVTIVSMERGDVDDERTRTCSQGLHFAAFSYASTWAGSSIRHVMVVKMDPADVVSIPNDHGDQKGRTCKMAVIAERTDFEPLPEREFFTNTDLGLAPSVDDDEGDDDQTDLLDGDEDSDDEGLDDEEGDDEGDDESDDEPEYPREKVRTALLAAIGAYGPDKQTNATGDASLTLDDLDITKTQRNEIETAMDNLFDNRCPALDADTTVEEIIDHITDEE